jgi:putative phosphoribosyl transferase
MDTREDRFADRTEAGRRLAERLPHLAAEDPVVLALPRGGVPVGPEIAKALQAPLDLVLVRKIGAPFQPELAVGGWSTAAGRRWC